MPDGPHDSFEPDEFPDAEWEAYQQAEALLERAEALLEVSRPADALALFQQALAQHPESVRGQCLLGFAYYMLDRYPEAERCAQQAIRLEPDEEWGHRLHAYVLAGMGRSADAVEAALQAAKLAPDSLPVIQVVVDTALGDSQKELAREWVEVARREYPADRETHQMLGEVAAVEGNPTAAETHFREALRIRPSTGTLCDLADALKMQRRYSEARACLDQAIRLDPTDRRARRALYFSVSRYDLAGCLTRVGLLGAGVAVAAILSARFHWHPVAAGAAVLALLLGIRQAWQWRRLATLPRSAAGFYRTERRELASDILSAIRAIFGKDTTGESWGDIFRNHGVPVLAILGALIGSLALVVWPVALLFVRRWSWPGYGWLLAFTTLAWAAGLRRIQVGEHPETPRGKNLWEEYWTYNSGFREMADLVRSITVLVLALGGLVATFIWPMVMLATGRGDCYAYSLMVLAMIWAWVQIGKMPDPAPKETADGGGLPVAAVAQAEETLPVAQVIAPPPDEPLR